MRSSVVRTLAVGAAVATGAAVVVIPRGDEDPAETSDAPSAALVEAPATAEPGPAATPAGAATSPDEASRAEAPEAAPTSRPVAPTTPRSAAPPPAAAPLPPTDVTAEAAPAPSTQEPPRLDWLGINLNNRWAAPQNPPPEEALDALAESGARWVRIAIPWTSVQADEGDPFDWSGMDELVDRLRARGLEVLLDLRSPPCWARADESLTCQGQRYRMYTPRRAPWEAYVTAAVRHFEGRVTHWQIWNEPNHTGSLHIPGVPSNRDERLVWFRDRIYIPAASAIRLADPSVKVTGPVLGANTGNSSPDELRRRMVIALGNGAAQLTDVVDIHAYPPGDAMEYGRAARRAMQELGIPERELWLTETGMKTEAANRLRPGANVEDVQAGHVRRVLNGNVAGGGRVYDKIFWFVLADPRSDEGQENHYGIVNDDWSPRPAYLAFQEFVRTARN